MSPDEEDPVVVLDPNDPVFAVDSASSGDGFRTEVPVIRAANETVSPPGISAAMAEYLCSRGVTDPATWAAFRLGAVDAATVERLLTPRQRRQLLPTGLSVPTFNPRQPCEVVGVVRLTPAQNRHAFVSPPAGIACATDIVAAPRIFLVTAPLTGLRLAQHGVRGIAIVEDPAVLPPMASWLSTRDVFILGIRSCERAAIRAALGPAGAKAIDLATGPEIGCYPPATLAALGLNPSMVQPGETKPIITPHTILDLVKFGRDRVAQGEATDALRNAKADIPDLVAAYSLGWLPSNVSTALAPEARRALTGRRLGNSIILPAFDDQKIAVDLLAISACGRAVSLFDPPRGLLAPEVLHAADDLIVSNSFRTVAGLYREGHRNVLLLRGTADACANATRIAAAGVRRVQVHTRGAAAGITEALRVAGLDVVDGRPQSRAEPTVISATTAPIPFPQPQPATTLRAATAPALELPPEPVTPTPIPVTSTSASAVAAMTAQAVIDPTALVFVEEEGRDIATFQAGTIRYLVTMRADGATQRRVVIRAHGKATTHDLDLANGAQRERTAGSASRQVGLPATTISGHLVQILSAVLEREDARTRAPAVAITDAEEVAGSALLTAPDLLDRVVADLGMLGWVGEERTKQLLFLGAVSRLLPRPLWTVYRSSGGTAPWQATACIAHLIPPEARTVLHRVTDAAVMHADPAALRHRLLVVEQAETMRPEGAVALRILRERGGIGIGTAGDVRGPVAVLAAAAGEVDHRCRDCFMAVTVDESPEQTARILADQVQRLGAPGATAGKLAEIVLRHHAAQRMLERLPISIPYAARIVFPAASPRHRAEHLNFLTLIQASALLHQRQRARSEGAVVATEADFEIAARLVEGLLGIGGDGLSRAARDLVSVVEQAKLGAEFTMADLPGLLPDATRWTLRAALQELVDFGYVQSPRGVRGRLRTFRLAATAAGVRRVSGIHLRAADLPQVGGLAEEGGSVPATTTRCAV
jgi:hypothetical protein